MREWLDSLRTRMQQNAAVREFDRRVTSEAMDIMCEIIDRAGMKERIVPFGYTRHFKTIEELAKELGINPRSFREWAQRGYPEQFAAVFLYLTPSYPVAGARPHSEPVRMTSERVSELLIPALLNGCKRLRGMEDPVSQQTLGIYQGYLARLQGVLQRQ